MRVEQGPGVLVDDGPDVGGRIEGVADHERSHGSRQHREHVVGDLLLKIQHAQCRAPLSGALECRDDHIVHNLFRQRRGVDQHDVLAAGFRDQRHDRPFPFGKLPVDQRRRFHGSGERDAGDARIPDQPAADARTVTGEQVQKPRRHAGFVEQAHRFGGDQRRLLGGFGRDPVAGGQCRADLARENGQRKVPRADAGEHAAALQG